MHNMKHVFEHLGRKYSGHILSDKDSDPPYYWFLPDDPDLKKVFPDDIAFVQHGNVLRPVYSYDHDMGLLEKITLLMGEFAGLPVKFPLG